MGLTISTEPSFSMSFSIDIGVFISIAISLIALYISIKTNEYNKNKGKTEQAIRLAKEFADILDSFSAIGSIIGIHEKELKLINKRGHVTEEVQFNIEELNKIYTVDEQETLKKFFFGDRLKSGIPSEILKVYGHSLPDTKEGQLLPNDLILQIKFKDIYVGILNSLEHFSMNFTMGLADDELIYQSLHQSFFNIVDTLYFAIASVNTTIEDKYYTNIITLYNSWVKKEIKIKQEIKATNAKANAIINPKSKI